MHRPRCVVALSLVVFAAITLAQHENADPQSKKIAKASDEGEKAMKRFSVPAGIKTELWAAEPLLANPVAFCLDEKGNIYVAETFRLNNGVTDNRSHGNWLDDELAARTVADRLAVYKKYKFNGAGAPDRVRMLYSSKGDGKIDAASIFADGFDQPQDGLGSGVLAHRGNVYFTCIPDLWLLKDTKGDHKADVKKSLQTGYGVHVAFIGHDSHGLKLGPDGKLYFSIGDRGFHVETEGRTVSQPDCGAVLRCNLDGSELEIVHTGLRNPQELAFDKYGNLFTVDNNADGGDQARITHIVDGGDTGWRIGHQYLNFPTRLGTWNAEKTWQPHNPDRSAYFVPPVRNYISGPSGFTYHPGVALLPEKYRDNFFICNFTGGSGGSGVFAFTLKPKGATFEFGKDEKFVGSLLATDCDFGPDGGFYISDWVEGWGMPGKGRIYRFTDPKLADDPLVKSTKELLATGMTKRDNAELVGLLAHDDMRVRLEAQYTLAERKAISDLESGLKDKSLLGRLHAIWGLGQIGRKDAAALKAVLPLLDDSEIEVRANAAKVLGEAKYSAAAPKLAELLKDDSPRVKYHAAVALGRAGNALAIPSLYSLLAANDNADPYLRQGAYLALASLKDSAAELTKAAEHSNPVVRLGAALALRKLEHEGLAKFLNDADPNIVLEAARGIYDTPIPAALPALAKIIERPLPDTKLMPPNRQEYLLRRVIAAHARLGGPENAKTLVGLASLPIVPEAIRVEALSHLQNWTKKVGRDPVIGVWRPIEPRSAEPVAEMVRKLLVPLMTSTDKVRGEAVKLAAQHGIKDAVPFLRTLATDLSKPAPLRVETLKALVALKDAEIEKTAEAVSKDADGRLRHEARRIKFTKAKPADIEKELSGVLLAGTVAEKQGALDWLAELKAEAADAVILQWLEKINDAPPEIQLDIFEAAGKRKTVPAIGKVLAGLKATGREALVGGDADMGRKLFHEKTELSCVRCHKINGTGGDVGPDLTGLGKRVKRDYILDALTTPDKDIAKGYETVVLSLTNGQVKSGILKSEDKKEVRIMTPEGQLLVVPTAQIDERNRGPSAMPADLIQKMSRRELRDLVEYLSRL